MKRSIRAAVLCVGAAAFALALPACTTKDPTTGAITPSAYIVALQHQCGLVPTYAAAANTVDALADQSKAGTTIGTVAGIATVGCAVMAANVGAAVASGVTALPSKDTVAPVTLPSSG